MLIPRRSSIQGSGIFTDAPLRARKKIGEYTGERISVREARRRAKTRRKIAIIEVTDHIAIDESTRGGGPFQFINHSCNPNVFIRVAYKRAEFYALRNIRAGEELTCDYGESHHEGKLPCRCGAKNCQKFI